LFARLILGISLLIVPVEAGAQSAAFAATAPDITPNEPNLLLAAEDWQALVMGTGNAQVCYVAQARPRAALGKREARPALYVTHRPNRQAYDVVAFAANYAFRADSMARVSFANGAASGPTHRLFTSGEFAWAGDEANDKRIVKAMAEHEQVTITALGSDGLLHEDKLSLKGFAAAFQRASSECRRPGAPIKR
jgi:hypothetical protein